MATALFTNWSIEEFIGYWNGKPRKYPAGKSEYMPDYLARHFAKHLANRELLRKDANGNPIYKDGERSTSPKKPEEVPIFMNLFNKGYTPDDTDESDSPKKDDVDTLIDVANKNKSEKQDPNQPQIVLPPEDDGDDESSFNNHPKE